MDRGRDRIDTPLHDGAVIEIVGQLKQRQYMQHTCYMHVAAHDHCRSYKARAAGVCVCAHACIIYVSTPM